MIGHTWVDKQVLPAWQAVRSRGDLSVLSAVVRGKLNLLYRVGTNQEHLKATMEWLCRAQDATHDDGVSAVYDIVANAWFPSYPETTGYIIPTFFDYAAFSGDLVYRARAVKMADWLMSLQLDEGVFPGPPWIEPRGQPIVFDTGQIIHGLVRTYEETGIARYLDAARSAGVWLTKVQEEDGSWRRFDLSQTHVYNTRTSWALLRLDQVEHNGHFRKAAITNLNWALCQQTHDGWFHNASFTPDEEPLTHTLAYTIEGLLQAGQILREMKYIESAQRAAKALQERLTLDSYLRGRYSSGWRPTVSWSCLTGNAQMALIWFTLYELTHDNSFLSAANAALMYIKQVQSRSATSPGIRGGVAGSYPIYGDYGHYEYLNWAAKFFADSLLMDEQRSKQMLNKDSVG